MKNCNMSCPNCASKLYQRNLFCKDIEGEIAVDFGDYNISEFLVYALFLMYYSTNHCRDRELLRQILLGIRQKDANNPCPWKQDLDYAYRFGSPCLKNLVERLIAQKMYRKNYDKRRYHRKS